MTHGFQLILQNYYVLTKIAVVWILLGKCLSTFTDKVSNTFPLVSGQCLKCNDCGLTKNEYTLPICRKRVENY